MPWLVKDKENPDNNLLFIHIPRCGGTSLSKVFNTEKKSRKGRDPWHWLGMIYFFYRYKLMESANFPWKTWENLIASCQIITSVILWNTTTDPKCRTHLPNGECGPTIAAYTLLTTGCLMIICSTFLMTAPFLLRLMLLRRGYGLFVGYILFGFVACDEYITGTSEKGFLIHFTAANMVKYGLIQEKDLDQADSFTIVRNPYSRMVSIYSYNRFGPWETFKAFTKRWVKMNMKLYLETGSTEEWDIYCHALPQFEFTHCQGKQIVKCIIKQEELKDHNDDKFRQRFSEIPSRIAKALHDMPHTNRRQRSKPWWDYYDQETQNLVAQAYATDFHVLGYPVEMPRRPDLIPPKLPSAEIAPYSTCLDYKNVPNITDLVRIPSHPHLIDVEAIAMSAAAEAVVTKAAIDEENVENQSKVTLNKVLTEKEVEQVEEEEESNMIEELMARRMPPPPPPREGSSISENF